MDVRRTASDYDLILNSNELSISVLKIESLSLKFLIEIRTERDRLIFNFGQKYSLVWLHIMKQQSISDNMNFLIVSKHCVQIIYSAEYCT